MRRQGLVLVVTAAVLVALGAAVAAGLGSALGLSVADKSVPTERLAVAPAADSVAPPGIGTIEAPRSARMDLAVATLREVVPRGDVTLTVRAGDDADSETYRLSGTRGAPMIEAEGPGGAALALYDLADRARTGRDLFARLGSEVSPRMPFRMVDLGAVGVEPDAGEWETGDDYSHASKAFADAILPGAPYVDTTALARAEASFDAYVAHVLAQGYNAIAVPGLLEYLDLPQAGQQDRAAAMRAAFGPLWKRAHDLGLRVYFRTDMLTLTPQLDQWFDDHDLTTEDPQLWDVYADGLDRMYEQMPWIDGVLVRIGEAGRVYDVDGWDFYSELAVTTVPAVRQMLTTLTAQAERADRELIFRSWSVGVGAVGDMHTNPESYEEVLHGIDSDHLIVSTKYTAGDFYSHLPFNPTFAVGSQRRIVELQSRREFEAFGSIPNDLGTLHAESLDTLPNVEGIWTWTQDGGPWRAGPMSLLLQSGFWQLYDLNNYVAGRLALDADTVPAEATRDWAREWFSDDPGTVSAITEAMSLSREAVTKGLYIGPFAEKEVRALGLEPPPMMWIFEWDILTGDSATLDTIYAVSRDRYDEAIAEGRQAVALARQMSDLVEGTDASTWKDPELRTQFVDSLRYQKDVFALLATYREAFLAHTRWLDTGSAADARRASALRDAFVVAADQHERTYGGNVDLPAWNLTAARLGTERADRDEAMAWLARGGLLVLAIGAVAARWRRPRTAVLVAGAAAALVFSRAVFTWFLAPAHLLLTLGTWAIFGVVVALLGRSALRPLAWVAVARSALLLAVLAVRGPGGYWFMMWTAPALRFVYVTFAFALFLAAIAVVARRATPRVALIASGLPMIVFGTWIGLTGLESALTTWNDQLALLPWGLSRILGITVYLGIPTVLPWAVAAVGAALLVTGVALHRRARPSGLG